MAEQVTLFAASYSEARDKFLAAATAARAELQAFAHPELGPDGEDLSTDVAWIGPADATAVLVMVSATHGVEGHCGSGAQVDWLRRNEWARLPEGVAALLIHAINPYGFAWSRRVTQENVDLNRNFVDFSAPLPANPEYAKLAEAVTPGSWSEAAQVESKSKLLAYARGHGFPALVQAMTGGQYSHPDGVFFGGAGSTWSRRTLETILTERLARARSVCFLDYHTGLGPEGYCEQIISCGTDAPEYRRARDWFGAAVASVEAGQSVSARIAGDWLDAAPRILPHAEVTGLAMEYGTVETNRVLNALRADNWLHTRGDPTGPDAAAIQVQMRSAFYVDTDLWRGMVLGQSLIATRQAVAGLAETVGA